MVLYDLEELEHYEQVSKDMNTKGKLEILAMVNNRLLKMRLRADYIEDQAAQRVIEDLSKFIRPLLNEELVHLGELAQIAYSGFSELWDLKSVQQTEDEFNQLRGQAPGARPDSDIKEGC